jgi:micrococcal nuclease
MRRRGAARTALALAGVGAIAALSGGCGLPELAGGDEGKAKGAKVVRTVDGDTIVVSQGGKERTVRLLQIDTPETVKPGAPVECGGPEASAAMKRMARPGERVKLVADPKLDKVDQYGRLLRYVEEDGRDLGLSQVKAGHAAVYTFEGEEGSRIDAYRRAEDAAREGGRGAWGECGGF